MSDTNSNNTPVSTSDIAAETIAEFNASTEAPVTTHGAYKSSAHAARVWMRNAGEATTDNLRDLQAAAREQQRISDEMSAETAELLGDGVEMTTENIARAVLRQDALEALRADVLAATPRANRARAKELLAGMNEEDIRKAFARRDTEQDIATVHQRQESLIQRLRRG